MLQLPPSRELGLLNMVLLGPVPCYCPTLQKRQHLLFLEKLVYVQTTLLSTTTQPCFVPAPLPLPGALPLQRPYIPAF